MVKNELLELEIVSVSTDGAGIGRYNGLAVFVPSSAVGDRLLVRIIKVTKSYAVGKIEEILTPSKDRVIPECTDCQKCGGCNFWHIDYKTELSYKTQFVCDNMKKLGGIDVDVKSCEASPSEKQYRNKVIYPVRPNKEGKPTFGFFAERSHRIIETRSCLIEPEIFSKIAEETINFMVKYGIKAYNEETNGGIIRNIFLRTTKKGEIMVCLVATKPFSESGLLAKHIKNLFPSVRSVVLNYNNKNTNVVLSDNFETVLGEDFIEDELCGLRFRISPASFYQINRDQAERLYNKAKELIAPKGREVLIDLYCGAGTIGLSMADSVKEVIGVEIVPEAIENANENARINGIKNAEFICADAGEGAKILKERGIKPDIIVVDPPRKGCTTDCLEVINSLSPEKICYISCNSATLARDMAVLEDFGYTAEAVYPFDMFPKTAHVECVVRLCRNERSSI